MGQHRTVTEIINGRPVEIDEGIVRLVRWMNRFPSVQTLFSCEGEDNERGREPYVSFRCGEMDDLRAILTTLDWHHSETIVLRMATVEVDWHGGEPRFMARFRSKYMLDFFQQHLEVLTDESAQALDGTTPLRD